MRTYIISIEGQDSPRWNKFVEQKFFSTLGSNYEIFGVVGGSLPCKQYYEQAVVGRSMPLTPGELGCTLSHLQALKKFLSTEDRYALILEDDARTPDDLSLDQLKLELDKYNLPKNILFSLGGIQLKVSSKVRGSLEKDFLNQKVIRVCPDFFHRVCSTFSYIVDRKMAQTLIDYHAPVRRADDWSYLYDFDSSVHIFMTYIIDHVEILKEEENLEVSYLQVERKHFPDLKVSAYGTLIRKNLSKLRYSKYKSNN